MKKNLFVLIVGSLLFSACYNAPERDCNKFKTGEFEYEYKVKDITKKARFTRNDSIEIDYHENHIDTILVSWINDCECVLRNKNPKTMAEKKAVHFKILSTKDNTYTFESKLINDPLQRKSKGTVTKIN